MSVEDGREHSQGEGVAATESDESKDVAKLGAVEVNNMTAQSEASQQEAPEADEFGLPMRPPRRRQYEEDEDDEFESADEGEPQEDLKLQESASPDGADPKHEAVSEPASEPVQDPQPEAQVVSKDSSDVTQAEGSPERRMSGPKDEVKLEAAAELDKPRETADVPTTPEKEDSFQLRDKADEPRGSNELRRTSTHASTTSPSSPSSKRKSQPVVSEWSHQQLAPAPHPEDVPEDDEDGWQEMPALATYRQYDDWGKVVAKSYDEVDDTEVYGYGGLGGAGKGYTRVQVDEDAKSATSMDDDTAYLFKETHVNTSLEDDEEARDVVEQMQTTKELLTEGQRIAYVGVVRLSLARMLDDLNASEKTRNAKKTIEFGTENMKMWAQKMMVRIFSHMEIDGNEQIMVEQLAEHGVLPSDMTPILMQNARVKNPQQEKVTEEEKKQEQEEEEQTASSAGPSLESPQSSESEPSSEPKKSVDGPVSTSRPETPSLRPPSAPDTPVSESPPPAYEQMHAEDLTIKDPHDLDNAKSLDLDIRWTILCDLFLLLIADSTYDARSRTLLVRVADVLSISWQEVCRFEKRVTDALEMQEQAEKENWDEQEHMDHRRKAAWKRKAMVMGLCTVGGGLVIGLSAGLLAPVIGAGLAAGFTAIGVSGTSTFLAGAGGAAIIGTTGVLTGGTIGVRASARRMGAVKTFEYRPLHNNKRVNLVVTVAGWITGKVDDVRLPFSTVDPVMGDIYSVHWEPEMLESTGQTIRILGTEALTQTIQQVLGSTILVGLMAGLSLPIVLTKLSYLIDNPWSVSVARADAAGLILADSLVDRNLGARPITLIGFSLGSRVIFSCLRELASRGAFGIIENVFLFGTPVVQKKDDYLKARAIVTGRFVNGYASNDWILGYLFRATSGGIMRVAGLSAIDIPGIENMDCTELVPGHMAYRVKMPLLLRKCGWLVESDEFTEIEDPDPENHEARQRQLISEIEEARLELEEKQKKKRGISGFFTRRKGKAAVKKDWETYDPNKVAAAGDHQDPEKVVLENQDVMFDVEAIRKEALALAVQGGDIEEIKKHLQVREIESTMPMMRISSTPSTPALSSSEFTNAEDGVNGQDTSSKISGTSDAKMSLSFDLEDRPAALRSQSATNGSTPGRASPALSSTAAASEDQPAMPGSARNRSPYSFSERPVLKSATTAPAVGATQTASSNNVWADDEDDDFGKEKEVKMSFD